ncbi:hypothetical protein QYF36_007758 [Acer negundo]|nr:hypothetical protein QYF36_007758 [Acer negundo]
MANQLISPTSTTTPPLLNDPSLLLSWSLIVRGWQFGAPRCSFLAKSRVAAANSCIGCVGYILADLASGTFGFYLDQQSPKKRPYHCHTQHQIQEMECFFKECSHNKQSEELSRELGLEPLQHENTQLRMENEKLRADNMRYREALGNPSCPNCGGPTTIDRFSALVAKYVGNLW